jgi:hypothetical protein
MGWMHGCMPTIEWIGPSLSGILVGCGTLDITQLGLAAPQKWTTTRFVPLFGRHVVDAFGSAPFAPEADAWSWRGSERVLILNFFQWLTWTIEMVTLRACLCFCRTQICGQVVNDSLSVLGIGNLCTGRERDMDRWLKLEAGGRNWMA